MATEVNQTFFAWSQGEATERDGSQGVSVSQTLDHGSISFGRFELESLSWEKWSVFTNDRRNEEFGKFNGLVAQKKAYFEEYYKKIRELKASQQQNQQTELTLEYSGDGSDSSQTAEDEQAADLETPTGYGTVVDDYMEGVAQETTSEHGLQGLDDRQNENLNTEFPSNISLSSGTPQHIDQDTRGSVSCDNSARKMDVEKQNARTPRRLVEKDSRLGQTPKIIPRSVHSLSKSALDYTFTRQRPASMKPSTSMNQKAKQSNVHPLQRPNATTKNMAGPAEKSKVTVVRRPSSASAQRPSSGERKPITRETSKKPSDVSTLRRPSTAERHPITSGRAQQQAIVSTPLRPSTSERRPVKRENAPKPAGISTMCRPSTGERQTITRQGTLRTDVKTPSKPRAAVAHSKGDTPTVGNLKMAITPNAARSKLDPRSNTNRLKGPSALDSSSNRSKRIELPVSGKHKSSSVNLPPRKGSNSNVGEPAGPARTRKKEGIQAQMRSRASSTTKKTTPLQSGNVKARAPNPPPPPPPPRRSPRTMSKPNTSTPSSIGGRKPKASTPQWH